jgi:hypothetical protein
MSKKTKAEKHARRVAKRPRHGAYRLTRKRRNRALLPLPVMTEEERHDLLVGRGLLKILSGLEDMGVIDLDSVLKRIQNDSDLVKPESVE